MAPSPTRYSEKVAFLEDSEADISLESAGSEERFNSFARSIVLKEQRSYLTGFWKVIRIFGIFVLGSGLGHFASSYLQNDALPAVEAPIEAVAACPTPADVAEPAAAPTIPPLSSQILPVDDSADSLEFHNSFFPATLDECPSHPHRPEFDEQLRRTALASFPRSGNTWTRNLLERSTGYQTGSIYEGYNANYSWIVKTHHHDAAQFARALVLVRNPIDVIYSYFNFVSISKAGGDGLAKNTGRVNITLLGTDKNQHSKAVSFAKSWVSFYDDWIKSSNTPHHLIRYEDMRLNPVPWVLSALAFVLPNHMPPLSHVACALANMPDREAYESRREENFGTWDQWLPSTRDEVLAIVKPWMCRFDYGEMLREIHGYDMQC